MGIFTRFRDIISSNFNSMLDKAEDPEKLIRLMIREMEDTLVEIKASCAGVMAERKKAERRLEEAYPYLILDARYERVREAGVIGSQAVLIAIGINWEGRRQVLGVDLANRESRSSWRQFLAVDQVVGAQGPAQVEHRLEVDPPPQELPPADGAHVLVDGLHHVVGDVRPQVDPAEDLAREPVRAEQGAGDLDHHGVHARQERPDQLDLDAEPGLLPGGVGPLRGPGVRRLLRGGFKSAKLAVDFLRIGPELLEALPLQGVDRLVVFSAWVCFKDNYPIYKSCLSKIFCNTGTMLDFLKVSGTYVSC